MSKEKKQEGSGSDIVLSTNIELQAIKQLALFTDPLVDGNTLIGYDLRPRFLHSRASKVLKLNEYADKGDRLFKLQDGTVYAIQPAMIDRNSAKVAIFPGTRESLVEEAIVGFGKRGEFDPESGDAGYMYDSSGLKVYFTLYQLWKQLQSSKKEYKYNELIEALRVLKGAGHYTGTEKDFGDGKLRKADGYGSYISDLVFVDHESPDEKNVKVDKFICVYLNREATKLIIDGKYKLYNENLSMSMKSPIARYLYKKLIQQLPYDPEAPQNAQMVLKQNEIILQSGYQIQDNATKRKTAFLNALDELVQAELLTPIDHDKIEVIKNGRAVVDVHYTVAADKKMFDYLKEVYARAEKSQQLTNSET